MELKHPGNAAPMRSHPIAYLDWMFRRPALLRVILLPVTALYLIAWACYMCAVIAYDLLVRSLFDHVQHWLECREFWAKLRRQRRVASWQEVQSELTTGTGTLVVMIDPSGGGASWLIGVPRDQLDPENVVPTLLEFETHGRAVLKDPSRAIARWSVEKLERYLPSASLFPADSAKRLLALDPAVRSRSVLVVDEICEGLLNYNWD